MTIIQTRNPEAEQLTSPDQAWAERNHVAEWYDNAGGTVTISAVTVPLAATRHNFAPELYTFASNILTINEAGLYRFDFLVAASKAGSTEGSFYAFLEEDPATAVFALVPSTTVYTTVFSAPGSVYGSVTLRAGVAYRYRLRYATFGVNFTLIDDGSHLSVMRLFHSG